MSGLIFGESLIIPGLLALVVSFMFCITSVSKRRDNTHDAAGYAILTMWFLGSAAILLITSAILTGPVK